VISRRELATMREAANAATVGILEGGHWLALRWYGKRRLGQLSREQLAEMRARVFTDIPAAEAEVSAALEGRGLVFNRDKLYPPGAAFDANLDARLLP
jgi:Xaa-Pro aminopeptidase